jgi:hypothetical protein
MNKVSLIIQVYNKPSHLQKLPEIFDALRPHIDKESVIVDDCSTDNVWGIIKNFNFSSSVILYQQTSNRGKGATIGNPERSAEAPVSNFIASYPNTKLDPSKLEIRLISPGPSATDA